MKHTRKGEKKSEKLLTVSVLGLRGSQLRARRLLLRDDGGQTCLGRRATVIRHHVGDRLQLAVEVQPSIERIHELFCLLLQRGRRLHLLGLLGLDQPELVHDDRQLGGRSAVPVRGIVP